MIGIRGDNNGRPTWTARGRGQDHYEHLSTIPNVRISHVVDIDERHFASSVPFMKKTWGGDPRTETDFRRVLENRDVDAVTIAAPDHWHALMTIWACQAGKDVYVEKPVSHNIVEGRRMIDAARRYNRVVAVGTQRRSGDVVAKAVQFLREGGLGTLHGARTVIHRFRDPIGVGLTDRFRPASTTISGSGRRHRVRSTKTTFTITGTGSGSTARATSGIRRSIRSTSHAGCSESANTPARRTASAACTKLALLPTR